MESDDTVPGRLQIGHVCGILIEDQGVCIRNTLNLNVKLAMRLGNVRRGEAWFLTAAVFT
jgi:hypothetical protein